VLAVAPGLTRGAAFFVASAAWFIGELNQWNYFYHEIEFPVRVVIFLFVLPALVFGLGVLFTRGFLRAGSPLLASLALPSYWVAYEYLTETGSPHGTFGNLGYTQMNCLPLIQIASITGIWGISFIVFLFAAAVASLLSGAGKDSHRRAIAISVGVVICAVFLFGEWRLRSHSPAQPVTITLIARDLPMKAYLGTDEEAVELLHEYSDEVRRATPAGTEVVVLPEKIARVTENVLPKVDARFASAAAETHAVIILGLVRQTSSGAFNEARFFSPEGRVQASYDKHHLIPGIEPETPGQTRVLINGPFGRWGLQICKDMDFPTLSREYGMATVSLLLVPAWDFNVDAWLHSRMAVLRSVENGFALARSARNGVLTLNDNRGRILTETRSGSGRFASISGKLSIARESTPYTRFGDWFAWLCVLTLVVLLALGWRGPRRQPEL
jgi:apolipoprotein N-acyltransferase